MGVRAGQVFTWAPRAWRIHWEIPSPQQELFPLLLEGLGHDPSPADQTASREEKGRGFRTPPIIRRGAARRALVSEKLFHTLMHKVVSELRILTNTT